jgi:flavodoxin
VNTLVVYFSKFGNTQEVAETIAAELEAAGPVRLLSADQLQPADLNSADLVVMGSPTHRMNLPQKVRPVLERLPKRALRGKRFAAFDTSYKMSPLLARFTAAKRLAQKLRRLGGKRVAPPETFHVMAREGPLHARELERARLWGRSLLDRLDGRRE